MNSVILSALALLLVASAVAVLARFVRIPYTLALVLAGLVLAAFHVPGLSAVHLTPQLLLTVLLPPLLFEASFHLDFQRFRQDATLILTLAGPALLVAVAVTAGLLWAAAPLAGLTAISFGLALLFASMIGATDPVSVLALFKEVGVGRRLYTIVEGESLLNDGVSVVLFLIVGASLGLDLHGSAVPEGEHLALFAVRTFVWMAGVGTGIGLIIGLIGSAITRQIEDRLVEIVLSTLVAWGSFMLAEQAHASGVLACVAAGMVHGNIGGKHGMSAATRVAVADFWEFAAFFSNTVIFLLLGLDLDAPQLASHVGPVAIAFGVVLIGRVTSVAATAALARALRLPSVPVAWWGVLVWGGLRGGLSMVLAIGLPQDTPGRSTLVMLVFGVVGISLLVQGLTMKPLLARLGVAGEQRPKGYDVARLQSISANRALAELRRMESAGLVAPALAAERRAALEASLAEHDANASALVHEAIVAAERRELLLHLLTVQVDAVRAAVHEGIADDEAAGEVLAELAQRRDAAEGHG